MIYFAEMIDHDESPIKIGVSDDPQKRIRQQQTGNPYILEVIATMPGDKETERELHQKFSKWRCLGGEEWFDRNPELDSLISNLREQKKRRQSLLLREEE